MNKKSLEYTAMNIVKYMKSKMLIIIVYFVIKKEMRMKRKIIFFCGVLVICNLINLFVYEMIFNKKSLANNLCLVYAKNQNVTYVYDSLGRVSTVRYPDGTEIQYEYDANGNLLSSKTTMGTGKADNSEQDSSDNNGEDIPASSEQETPAASEEHGTSGSNEQNTSDSGEHNTTKNDGQSGNNQVDVNPQTGYTTGNDNSGQSSDSNPASANNRLQDTEKNIKNYNRFKSKKPIIQSLKVSKSSKKHQLKIKIKQINKRGTYGESGYQIKYAVNHRFKQAKTITIPRSKKGSVTSEKWSIKRNKTYYVKVRAVMKTQTGKVIYSKYSKTIKIKVK